MVDKNGETATVQDAGKKAEAPAPTAEDKAAALSGVQEARAKARTAGRKPSFKTLRSEHDALMLTRSVLLMVGGLVLLFPISYTYVGIKLILFVLLAYAAIFNVKAMGEEANMRNDKASHQAHIWSYVAFTVVTICFAFVTVRAGIAASQYQAAINQALDALEKAGLPAIVVK